MGLLNFFKKGNKATNNTTGKTLNSISEIISEWSKPEKVLSIVQNLNILGIETEEIADVILKYEKKQLNLHIDYLQKPFQRGIKVLFERGWCEWDLNYNKIKVFDYTSDLLNETCFPKGYHKNDMYLSQSKAFIKALDKNDTPFTDLIQGIESLNLALEIKKQSI